MTDLLELLAQLAVTIAALSAVAGAARSPVETSETHYLLRDVALLGLTVALYSFLPLLLLEAEITEAATLRVCAGLAGACWAIGYLFYLRRIWGQWSALTAPFYVALAVTLAGQIAFVRCVVEPGSVAYLSGLACLLAIASLNFISAVFSPARDPA